MKKPSLLILICTAFTFSSFSQSPELNIKVGARGLFVEHTVSAKENFYSLGREFSVHPKRLAAFNKLDMSKGLTLGQIISIPLSDTNFVHHSADGTALFYQSSAKQSVGVISAISKTPAADIRDLNHFTSDEIPANTRILVGFLLAEAGTPVPVANEGTDNKPVTEEKKLPATETLTKNNEPANTTVKIEPVKDEPKALPVKAEPVREVPKATIGKTGSVKEDTKPLVREIPKTAQPEKQRLTAGAGDGFFKVVFLQQVKAIPLSKEETVTSGIFKSTSGWNDAKFYGLMDGVEPGTVIKVINPSNNREVYAKVLGAVSGIRQNQGLNLRISNAAAAALDITDTDKFIVRVNY